ncbi:MAG: hypothetical protein ABF318_02140 [Ketobacter sp.]
MTEDHMNPVQPIVQRVLLATGFGFIVFFSFVLLSAFLVRNDTQFQRLLYQQDFTYLYQIGMIATVCAFAAYCGGASRIKVLIKTVFLLPGSASPWVTSIYWVSIVSLYFSLFFSR